MTHTYAHTDSQGEYSTSQGVRAGNYSLTEKQNSSQWPWLCNPFLQLSSAYWQMIQPLLKFQSDLWSGAFLQDQSAGLWPLPCPQPLPLRLCHKSHSMNTPSQPPATQWQGEVMSLSGLKRLTPFEVSYEAAYANYSNGVSFLPSIQGYCFSASRHYQQGFQGK